MKKYILNYLNALLILLAMGFYFICETWFADLKNYLVQEDNFGENLQFVFYLLASLLFFRSMQFFKGSLWNYLTRLGMALLLFFFAGEEINWGSRVFKFQIAFLVRHSEQHETNLHNLLPLYANVAVYIYFALAFGLLLPAIEYWLKKKFASYQPYLHDRGYLAAYVLLLLLYLFLPQAEHIYFYEFSELLLAWLFFRVASRDCAKQALFTQTQLIGLEVGAMLMSAAATWYIWKG